jgi:hypothetical protein
VNTDENVERIALTMDLRRFAMMPPEIKCRVRV